MLSVFIMITGMNKSKTLKHINVNVMVKNVTRIKIGITINVGASAKIRKNIMRLKKIIFGILLHIVLKKVNI